MLIERFKKQGREEEREEGREEEKLSLVKNLLRDTDFTVAKNCSIG